MGVIVMISTCDFLQIVEETGFFSLYATHVHLLVNFCLKWTFEKNQSVYHRFSNEIWYAFLLHICDFFKCHRMNNILVTFDQIK